MLILSALNGVPGWYRPDGALGADAIAEHFADLLLRGLGSEEARAGAASAAPGRA